MPVSSVAQFIMSPGKIWTHRIAWYLRVKRHTKDRRWKLNNSVRRSFDGSVLSFVYSRPWWSGCHSMRTKTFCLKAVEEWFEWRLRLESRWIVGRMSVTETARKKIGDLSVCGSEKEGQKKMGRGIDAFQMTCKWLKRNFWKEIGGVNPRHDSLRRKWKVPMHT